MFFQHLNFSAHVFIGNGEFYQEKVLEALTYLGHIEHRELSFPPYCALWDGAGASESTCDVTSDQITSWGKVHHRATA